MVPESVYLKYQYQRFQHKPLKRDSYNLYSDFNEPNHANKNHLKNRTMVERSKFDNFLDFLILYDFKNKITLQSEF